MMIYDDIFSWEGWGGKLRLASGSCRLRIHDLTKDQETDALILRPKIVIVSDLPDQAMSVRSCAGHIATIVVDRFRINPQRMLWVEYYPASHYGRTGNIHHIPDRFDVVEFEWHGHRAIRPKWRVLKPPILDVIKGLVKEKDAPKS